MSHLLNGVGICTALGTGLAHCVSRINDSERDYFRDPSIIGVDGLGVVMSPVIEMGDERDVRARVLTLLAAAMADLAKGVVVGEAVPLMVCLPQWLQHPEVEQFLRERIQPFPECPFGHVSFIWPDEMTFMQLIDNVATGVANGEASEVLVAVADTMLDPTVLDALAADNRILSAHQPHGLIPSEAAVVFRITTQAEPLAADGTGYLTDIERETDPVNLRRPEGLIGGPLAGLVRRVAKAGPVHRLISDTNGERWRAEELSHVMARNADLLPEPLRADFEVPALSVGHCGIAMPGVILALTLADGPLPAQDAQEWTLAMVSQYGGERVVVRVGRQVQR